MKATAIRPYRCLCIECEPLPPIEGLHPLTFDNENEAGAQKPRSLLGLIAEKVMPLRRQGEDDS